LGMPVTHTTLTISGEVENPITVTVPVGTFIKDIFKRWNINVDSSALIIDGGPMMGKTVSLETPVTKVTKGVLVFTSPHYLSRESKLKISFIIVRARSACCQCVMCTELCPRFLLGHDIQPHLIMRAVAEGGKSFIEKLNTNVFLCSECGLCELYACPMQLSPRRINAWLKAEIGKPKPQEKKEIAPHPERNIRQTPTSRIILRSGLASLDKPAPWIDDEISPHIVRLMLKQHVGAPSLPVVREGQAVTSGELIATIPEGSLGANIHTSIKGRVSTVTEDYIEVTAV